MNRQQIKKWSLLRHLNFKGYKRTASGNPLNMVKVMSPSQLTIYGNAVQDGTPSPDVPVEVQLCGDRTGNLFDVTRISGNLLEVTDNKVYLSDYVCPTSISPKRFLEMTGLNPGDTITCSNDTEIIHGVANSILGRVSFSNLKGGGNFILRAHTTRTSTIPSDFNNDNYGSLILYGANQADESGERLAVMSNLAIYKGSYTADTLPAYEPYGYKVSGRTEGLNLLSSAWEDGNINIYTGNNEEVEIRIRTADYIKCKPNTVYTFYTPYSVIGVQGYDADKTYVDFSPNTTISSTLTFTTNENVEYLRFITQSSDGTRPDKTLPYMLVQGSYTAETMPPYEPYQPPQDFAVYLPEQIAKVGDVADEVVVDMEKQTAEIRKNIIQDTFTGDDGWYTKAGATDTQRYFALVDSSLKVNDGINVLCTHSVRGISAPNFGLNTCWLQSFSNGTAWFGICVDTATYPDVNSFEAFVSQQYNSGHALSIYHAIEPVTTDITALQQWDAMPNIEGTVSITFDSTIPISNAEAEYHSKEYDAT